MTDSKLRTSVSAMRAAGILETHPADSPIAFTMISGNNPSALGFDNYVMRGKFTLISGNESPLPTQASARTRGMTRAPACAL